MKTQLTFSIFILLLLSIEGINAQTGSGGCSFPLKPQSPLFGKDIVMNDQPSQNQRQVAICSAFNGWLFAVTTSYDSLVHGSSLDLLRSIDSGITWTVIYGYGYPVQFAKIHSLNIVAIGDSISNLKVFEAGLYTVGTSEVGQSFLYRFNGETGDFEANLIFDFGLKDIGLASDYNYPASNSNPSSLGLVYSIDKNNKDSIVFRSSSNGGLSLDNKQLLATSTTTFYNKVALNYGRSPSFPSGRYFTIWEEKSNQSSNLGHIYTSHSEPNFNSAFTTPVCLDCLDPASINKVRNPSIACQFNNTDNSSGNLSEVVIFEKYLPSSNSFTLEGFYNLQATTTNNFNAFTISTSSNNILQPSVNFNPYNSLFMLTYFDSTEKKLPFLTNDVNLGDPNGWNIVTQAYNDNNNLISPYPKVNINFEKQNGMNVWISEGSAGNGIALFDAPYSTWTGNSEINSGPNASLVWCYPNPCNDNLNIGFELIQPARVSIKIIDIMGKTLGVVLDKTYTKGNYVFKYDVKPLHGGTYFYNFTAKDFTTSGKFLILR